MRSLKLFLGISQSPPSLAVAYTGRGWSAEGTRSLCACGRATTMSCHKTLVRCNERRLPLSEPVRCVSRERIDGDPFRDFGARKAKKVKCAMAPDNGRRAAGAGRSWGGGAGGARRRKVRFRREKRRRREKNRNDPFEN
ncbi:hypothetical protein EVAR_32552_1 [Eumeta japonica]|uniref:Uncharacterized protein n=1 Tax=Eumeta variegata TaxID=151549 RepID=A0A4C1VSB9_EUMVA|nr:hypothetical protein EVAR_32552_1 [Eumeta japonica]